MLAMSDKTRFTDLGSLGEGEAKTRGARSRFFDLVEKNMTYFCQQEIGR